TSKNKIQYRQVCSVWKMNSNRKPLVTASPLSLLHLDHSRIKETQVVPHTLSMANIMLHVKKSRVKRICAVQSKDRRDPYRRLASILSDFASCF
ncbi:hypothetical protein L9F63_000128, partial [Diploptera punctata]